MRIFVVAMVLLSFAVNADEFPGVDRELVPISEEEVSKLFGGILGKQCEEIDLADGVAARSVYQLSCLVKHVRSVVKERADYGVVRSKLLEANVVVHIRVENDGSYSVLEMNNSTLDDDKLNEYIINAVRSFKFKAQNVRPFDMAVEIVF